MVYLPREIMGLVYQFDPTYHDVYKECVAHVRLCRARKIRLAKEVERLRWEPEVHVDGTWRPYHRILRIIFRQRMYRLLIPFDYPFEPPVVEIFGGQRFRPFDVWSPAAGLLTVLATCDAEGNAGTEPCLT